MASKRRLRRKADRLCQRKVSYTSKWIADRAMEELLRKPDFDRLPDTHAYHCPSCSRWHIGRYRRQEASG